MAKQVTALGLSRDVVRGVRLDEAGESLVRGLEEAWPLVAEPVEAAADAEAAGDDGATAEVVVEDRPLVRAFRDAAKRFGTREFVLSVPLSRLLVKTVRLPAEAREDLVGAAQLELDGISPFSDEVLAPGVEVVAETDTEVVAVMAALPSAAAEEISEALVAAKVHVTQTDATALGWLRGLWSSLCETPGLARRLVLLDLDGEWDLVVLDADAPTFIRGIGTVDSPAELCREITLSLLSLDGGAVDEVVVCAHEPPDDGLRQQLLAFGPVRTVQVEDDFAGVEGSARRSVEGSSLDVTPETWREARAESRFRRAMFAWLGVFVGIWVLLMGVLFGYDTVYDLRKDHQKRLQNDPVHKEKLRTVTQLKERVKLVERYADRARGALEMLKYVSDSLPVSEDIVLRSFTFVRDDKVSVSGNARDDAGGTVARKDILAFKESLQQITLPDSEQPVFDHFRESGGARLTAKGVQFQVEGFLHGDDEDGKGGGK